jgi:hypothetical protein
MLADKMRLRTDRDHGLSPVADTDGHGHGLTTTTDIVAANGANISDPIATDSRTIEPCASKG